MIYIEKGEKAILPKKYHGLNNLSAIIYDQLREIFQSDNYNDLWKAEFDINKKNQVLLREFKAGKIHSLDWMKANGLNEEIVIVLAKHLIISIVSDFVDFIYESLNCAKKGKMTVAYALLRKPFSDELLILEQLLYDPHDFIQRFFHSGNPNEYDPSSRALDKKLIIRNALTKIKPQLILNEDLIYEIRYDKTSEIGINGISNQALHIVTNDKNYKTDDQNLNFVFSVDDDIKLYWNHYYFFVPYLLLYSASIIDALIFKYLDDEGSKNLQAVKSLRRVVGTVVWAERVKTSMKESSNVMFDAMKAIIEIECKNCLRQNKFSRKQFESFFETEELICSKCKENVLVTHKSIEPIKEYLKAISQSNQNP